MNELLITILNYKGIWLISLSNTYTDGRCLAGNFTTVRMVSLLNIELWRTLVVLCVTLHPTPNTYTMSHSMWQCVTQLGSTGWFFRDCLCVGCHRQALCRDWLWVILRSAYVLLRHMGTYYNVVKRLQTSANLWVFKSGYLRKYC